MAEFPANFPFNYSDLPLKDAVDDYIRTGQPVGDFLTGVLSNDLSRACRHADSSNIHMIPVYYTYLYNNAPVSCYGSIEHYEAWVEKGGMEGQYGKDIE